MLWRLKENRIMIHSNDLAIPVIRYPQFAQRLILSSNLSSPHLPHLE